MTTETSSFEERAEAVLACVFRGIHHAPNEIKKVPGRWEVSTHPLSTYDFDELTRLVIAAHDFCIRASVMHSGPRLIKIMLHERKREGGLTQKHPTIEQAIENIRATR